MLLPTGFFISSILYFHLSLVERRPPYKTKVNNPVAYSISEYAINLPCSLEITQAEVDYICRSLLSVFGVSGSKN